MPITNRENNSTYRNRLSKEIILSIRTLMKQAAPNDESRDVSAFIILALEEVNKTIDQATEAWEKRDFWIKADKYRMEWAWMGACIKDLKDGLQEENWTIIAQTAIKIGEKLNHIVVSENHRLGTPWIGAYEMFKQKIVNI